MPKISNLVFLFAMLSVAIACTMERRSTAAVMT